MPEWLVKLRKKNLSKLNNHYVKGIVALKDDLQSLLCSLKSLFVFFFVLLLVRRHKM